MDEQGRVRIESVRGSETVLLVEDEDVVRDLVRLELLDNGYTVLHARNGEEALVTCELHRGKIQLVIADVVVPGVSGPELCDRLRPLFPEMKVLYMSGYTDSAVLHKCSLGPGAAFIEKPFTPDRLLRKAREVLDGTQQRSP